MPPRTDRTGPDPADVQAIAEERFGQLQAETALPPPPHVRNINLDTHVGHYPQRPYAAIEDRMGAATQGPATFEALRDSLPPGPGNEIEPDGQGNWVRWVPQHTGESVKDKNGVLMHVIEDVPRYVALTQESARASSASGRDTDWWSGFTWMRRGYKPEKDFNASARRDPQRIRFERAGPYDQAVAERLQLQQAATEVVPSAPEGATAPSPAQKDKV